jgi:hypothetical protein
MCRLEYILLRTELVITPNSDTPYCMAWVDLRAEPVVFTIPEIEKERFYEVQLIDALCA